MRQFTLISMMLMHCCCPTATSFRIPVHSFLQPLTSSTISSSSSSSSLSAMKKPNNDMLLFQLKKFLVPNTSDPPPYSAEATAAVTPATPATTATVNTELANAASTVLDPSSLDLPSVADSVADVAASISNSPITTTITEKVAQNVDDITQSVQSAKPSLLESVRTLLPMDIAKETSAIATLDTTTLKSTVDAVVRSGSSATSVAVNDIVQSLQANHQELLRHIHDAPRAPGSVPILADYLAQGKVSINGIFARLDVIAKSLQTKGLPHYEGFSKPIPVITGEKITKFIQSIPLERLTTNVQAFLTKGMITNEAIDALDLDELGGWYIGGIAVLLALSQSGTDVTAASKFKVNNELEARLSQALQDSEAATSLVQELTLQKESMEDKVKQLAEATAAVAKELMQLKAEKSQRDFTIAELTSDLRNLKSDLASQHMAELEIRTLLEQAEYRLEKETANLRAQLEKRDAVEAQLKRQVNDLQSRLNHESELLRIAQKEANDAINIANSQIQALLAEKSELQSKLDKLVEPTPSKLVEAGAAADTETNKVPISVTKSKLANIAEQTSLKQNEVKTAVKTENSGIETRAALKSKNLSKPNKFAARTTPKSVKADVTIDNETRKVPFSNWRSNADKTAEPTIQNKTAETEPDVMTKIGANTASEVKTSNASKIEPRSKFDKIVEPTAQRKVEKMILANETNKVLNSEPLSKNNKVAEPALQRDIELEKLTTAMESQNIPSITPGAPKTPITKPIITAISKADVPRGDEENIKSTTTTKRKRQRLTTSRFKGSQLTSIETVTVSTIETTEKQEPVPSQAIVTGTLSESTPALASAVNDKTRLENDAVKPLTNGATKSKKSRQGPALSSVVETELTTISLLKPNGEKPSSRAEQDLTLQADLVAMLQDKLAEEATDTPRKLTFFAKVETPPEIESKNSFQTIKMTELKKSKSSKDNRLDSSSAKVKSDALPADLVDDWSKLTPSAIKRKRVTELTDYLMSKGLPVTGEDGKILKKDALVGAVLSVSV